MLNLSQNRISSIGGLASAPSLVALNLGAYANIACSTSGSLGG